MNITDLPEEIVSCIGDFLDKESLLQILLTCQRLHMALKNQLWKSVVVHNRPQPIHIDKLKPHANFVQHIQYAGHFPSEYFQIAFPRLRDVYFGVFRSNKFSASQLKYRHDEFGPRDKDIAAFVRQNPQIRYLYINAERRTVSEELWGSVLETLHRPTRLEYAFRGSVFIQPAFWEACTSFEEISINGSILRHLVILSTLTFPRLLRLSIVMDIYFTTLTSHSVVVELFKLCPNLTHLHWKARAFHMGAGRNLPFVGALEQRNWPRLEDLSLEPFNSTDEVVSNVIRCLPPLKRLHLAAPHFAEQSFFYLQAGLFSSLRSLDLSRSLEMTSRMVLDTLLQCAQLEVFRAYHVSVVDIKATPQLWACVGLKELQVYFASDPTDPEANILVFKQLAKLASLERLDVGANWSSVLSVETVSELKSRGTLQFSLRQGGSCGLECLSTLSSLRNLSFMGTVQDMREEDVEWMCDQWPILETVNGQFSEDSEKHERIVAVLKRKGIKSY